MAEESTSLSQELSLLWNNPRDFYDEMIRHSDPRVKDWLWMQSPLPTLSLISLYLLFVYFGPKFMKDRPPFQMKALLFVFNSIIVVFYIWLTREYLLGMFEAQYNWICQPVSYSLDPAEMRIARGLWWYYFAKFVEFFDTVFFIMRKKNNQVTFLHVYHHASMFFLWWIGVKWVAGGQSILGALVNSVIHIIMYAYYALSCLGPGMQKYLWWKKHITHMQLLQFSLAIIHAFHSLYVDCNFPKWMHYVLIGYAFSFILLFTNFYIHAYIKKGNVAKSESQANGHTASHENGAHENGAPSTTSHDDSKKRQ